MKVAASGAATAGTSDCCRSTRWHRGGAWLAGFSRRSRRTAATRGVSPPTWTWWTCAPSSRHTIHLGLGFAVSGTAPFKDQHKLKRPAEMILMSKPL